MSPVRPDARVLSVTRMRLSYADTDPAGLVYYATWFGWMERVSTEWMFARNWTAFIEYDYIEFDKKNEAFTINPALIGGATLVVNADLKNKLSIAKVGVNYKFGGPVVARY